MKFAVLLLAVLCMVFVLASCKKEGLTDETFVFSNGRITGLTEEGKKKSELVIPASFGEGENIETVTTIGIYALKDADNLKKVTISEGITKIEGGAFKDCTVETVVLPETMEYIGDSAFVGCTNLTTINIPKSVKYIGKNAFQSCRSLKKIEIKSGFTVVPQAIFSNCEKLEEVVLPEGVTAIGNNAFTSCDALTNLDFISDSITTIGNNAFYGCLGLVDLVIPESVTEIGTSVFARCTSLKTVYIPASVVKMGTTVFSGCEAVELISCEAEFQPATWNSNWNPLGLTVEWGVTK